MTGRYLFLQYVTLLLNNPTEIFRIYSFKLSFANQSLFFCLELFEKDQIPMAFAGSISAEIVIMFKESFLRILGVPFVEYLLLLRMDNVNVIIFHKPKKRPTEAL